ncbi:MAG TPA: 50S ribosomal protein L25, partial [Desulfurivibrionaceae bacterium]|nr:50S ribosomal protein L25 [Desulfurivibrionaceae bacterium]
MLQVEVTAQVRTKFGKGAARTMRRAGQTPAVVYGKQEAVALELDTHTFTKTLLSIHRKNAVINLAINDGKKQSVKHVLPKEIQTDPLLNSVVHADFYEISLDEPLTFVVPIRYTGKAKGVDMGGDMTILKEKLTLKGKALDIPDAVEVNVTPLGIGDKMTFGDIQLPAGVTMLDAPAT